MEDIFFRGLEVGGWFRDDPSAWHFLCTLFVFCGNLRIFSLDFRVGVHTPMRIRCCCDRGRAQEVMWAAVNIREASLAHSLAYLLLWGLVLNRPWTSPGDPCPTGSKLNLLYIEGPSPPKPIDLLQSYLPLHTPKQADCLTCKSLEKSSIFQLLCFR